MKINNESKLKHVMNWSSQRLEINLKKIMKGCILKVEVSRKTYRDYKNYNLWIRRNL
jgi:hypothetical protein